MASTSPRPVKPKNPDATPVAQPLETLDDAPGTENLRRRHAEAPRLPPVDQPGVELHQVHRLASQAGEPLLRVGDRGRGDVLERVGFETDLGGEDHLRAGLVQHAAEIGLGPALPVGPGGVEVVDAQAQGVPHRAELLVMAVPCHQAADVAAAETDL